MAPQQLTSWSSEGVKILLMIRWRMGMRRMRAKGKISAAWVDLMASSANRSTSCITVKRCIRSTFTCQQSVRWDWGVKPFKSHSQLWNHLWNLTSSSYPIDWLTRYVCVCVCVVYVRVHVCACMCACMCAHVPARRSLFWLCFVLCNGLCAPVWRNNTFKCTVLLLPLLNGS